MILLPFHVCTQLVLSHLCPTTNTPPGGPAEAERIESYMTQLPALRPLTLVVKQFLAQRCLNEVYTGGLGSYAIMLMVLSFLQMHQRPGARSARANLGVLLIEFFEL